jgi:mycothiol synthase
VLLGLGIVSVFAMGAAMVGDYAAPSERGLAMGMLTTAMGLGFALGPLLGGVLAELFGTSQSLLVMALLSLLAAAFAWFTLVDVGVSRGVRAANPFANLRVLATDRLILLAAIANLLISPVFNGVIVNFVPIQAGALGFSAMLIGGLFALRALASSLTRLPTGVISTPRWSYRVMLVAVALAGVAVILIANATDYVGLSLALIAEGISFGDLSHRRAGVRHAVRRAARARRRVGGVQHGGRSQHGAQSVSAGRRGGLAGAGDHVFYGMGVDFVGRGAVAGGGIPACVGRTEHRRGLAAASATGAWMMATSTTAPRTTARLMQHDDDYARMRHLLLDTVPITPIGFNWDMRRLDGKRFYNADLAANRLLQRPVQLWEAGEGRLAGYVVCRGAGGRTSASTPRLSLPRSGDGGVGGSKSGGRPRRAGGARELEIYVYEYDALRQQIFTARGYEKLSYGGMCRHMRLGAQPLPVPEVADGYTLRTTDPADLDDCQRIADLLNAAFGRDFHNAQEYQHFAQYAPCFRRDLDLVMVAPDGSFAAYIGVPYDDANRRGIFEPVCTHPDHQRKGLARALLLEGLHRLRAIGALDATVDTGDAVAANAFYTAMGFTEAYRGYAWRKVW